MVQSVNSLIYGYSWYLDIVSPDWEALVLDDYEAVFPLTHRKKIFRYLYQPYFTQQLGLFYKNEAHEGLLDEFLNCIPESFRYIDIQLNEHNQPDEKKWRVKKRKNFVLDLNKPAIKLMKDYNNQTLRNIKKSNKQNLTIKPVDSSSAVDYYMKTKGEVTIGVDERDYARFKLLLTEVEKHNMLICRGVYANETELVATAIIYTTSNRLYLINNCVTPRGKELRAMYHLLDHLILQFAEQPMLLDFEGSDIPGVADFNKSFGAARKFYSRLKVNKLPWFFKLLKN